MNIKLNGIYLLILIVLLGCTENKYNHYKFTSELAQYDIAYPLKIYQHEDNFIEITNYKSEYDSIKTNNRYPILYLFITDTIVSKSEIVSLTGDNKIDFADYYVYDEKFKIPENLFKNKKGRFKLTIAILDIIVKDTIEANSKALEDKINMDMIDSRSYHDIIIE